MTKGKHTAAAAAVRFPSSAIPRRCRGAREFEIQINTERVRR